MTNKCPGGGPSRIKPSAPGTAQIGSAAIEYALRKFASYALSIVPLIDAIQMNTLEMCPQDPPPMPVWDGNDFWAFASGMNVPWWDDTAKKVAQLVYNVSWDVYCECVDGSLPIPTKPIPPPDGVSYGAPVGLQPCAMGGWAGDVPQAPANPPPAGQALNVGYRLLPSDGTTRTFTSGGSTYVAYKKLPGVTDAKWTRKSAMSDSTIPSVGPNVYFQEWNDANVQQRAHALDLVHDNPQDSGVFSIASGTTWMTAYAAAEPILSSGGNIIDPLVTVNMEWYCGVAPDTISNCCPPDPSISLALNNLIQITTNIQQLLAGGISGYVDGTRHANLRDSGSVTLVGDARAVRVETHPPGPPVIIIPGTPSYYFDMGFITPIIAGSPLRSTRLTFNPQTIELPRFTDQLGYTLLNGITVDLVELVPDSSRALP